MPFHRVLTALCSPTANKEYMCGSEPRQYYARRVTRTIGCRAVKQLLAPLSMLRQAKSVMIGRVQLTVMVSIWHARRHFVACYTHFPQNVDKRTPVLHDHAVCGEV